MATYRFVGNPYCEDHERDVSLPLSGTEVRVPRHQGGFAPNAAAIEKIDDVYALDYRTRQIGYVFQWEEACPMTKETTKDPIAARPIMFESAMIRSIIAGIKCQTRRLVTNGELKVMLDRPISSDLPMFFPKVTANKGSHVVRLNPQGAVSIQRLNLGLKPGEFEFRCPYVTGKTVLATHNAHGSTLVRAYRNGTTRWMVQAFGNQRLWVRERWRPIERSTDGVDGVEYDDGTFVSIENTVEASEQWMDAHDNGRYGAAWRSRMYMPRWASRIDLVPTLARLERLHDLTEEDAKAEGVEPFFTQFPCIGRDQRLTSGELVRDHPYRASYALLWDKINGKRALWASNPWCWAIYFQLAHVKPATPLRSNDWNLANA